MDDVVIDISMKDERKFGYAMQLKQKDNDSKKLSPESFETANGPFSLKRYCQAFKNLNQRNRQYQFILYTNAEFDPQKATKVTNFNMIKDDRCNGDMFFNTSSEKENVYRFEVNDKTPSDKEITKSDYKEFFSRFTIFVCQKNFKDLERAVIKILENETAAMNYTNLFRKWHQGRFTNKTINKATVNVHLIDIFLSPFVNSNSYLLTAEYEKWNLFQRVVEEFDVVLINDSFENVAMTMTEISEEEVTEKYKTYRKMFKMHANVATDESIMRIAKENKIIEKSVTSLELEVKLKVLQLFDEDSLSVVMSTRSLPENLSWRRISIKENQIYDHLTRPINILCADPGMGKSTMLKKLRKDCDSKFWIIAIDLKTHNKFLKTKHDINDLLNYLLEGNQDNFSDQIRNIFRSKKKMVFFFDGLDEIETQYTDNVLNYVKELSSKGYHIWLSSRRNLKDKLKASFGEFIMDMEEVKEGQQKSYIGNRLEKTYEYGEIKNLINKIFNSTDIINNCQVLGIPLQLYIITQTFLDDRELYDNITENIFVLTKMYNLFFRGKFKHHRDKEQSNNPHLDLTDMEDCLEKYELLAVHSMFDDNVFQKLNLDMRRTRRFLHEFKTNKDLLGIVTKVNTEEKAEFEHYTYGEYFAANFFANNFDKARIIQKELFFSRYKNLMMILNIILAEESPLHLALIYENMDQFAKHVKNKTTGTRKGLTSLHLAVLCKKTNAVKLLIEKGASVNAVAVDFDGSFFEYVPNKNKKSPLYFAAVVENVDMVNKGAFVEIVTNDNESPSHLAVSNRNTEIVQLLIGKGACVNAVTHWSETALHVAASDGNVDVVELLIENGAWVDASTKNKETPLHLAAFKGNMETAKLLIKKGASVNAVTSDNKTPLHFAIDNGEVETATLLIEGGASVDAETDVALTKIKINREDVWSR
ncbi:hypothetical protein GEV33_006730 [Tenebrio molitor]|uniref:NACHT domain-containing protein n=1 Tax=Tenebrio molitor TaxID=7067 RepID=A0A8J6HJH1_TENMO|nr:hypothetical protein GEV33_006730 [Tenebrio molitor]